MTAPGLQQIGNLSVYAFSPGQLDVFAQPVDGGFEPIAPGDILSLSGATAALDGPEFQNCPGQQLPYGNASYAVSRCGYPQFLVQGSGISHPGSRPTEGHTLSIVNGSISIAQGAQAAPGASVAVQLWPPLVIDSRIVASNIGSNATVERRAALAVLPGGSAGNSTLAFIVGVGDMFSFAAAIQALGATFAGYTDGGGSAALVPGPSGTRPIPTWLIVRGGGSMGPILGALAVTAIAAGILYATVNLRTLGVKANPVRDKTLQLWRWTGKNWIAEGVEVERGSGVEQVEREFEQKYPGFKFEAGFRRPNRPPSPDEVVINLSDGARIWIGALQTFPFKPKTDRPYDFYASYLAPRLHGPGTGRTDRWIDESGALSYERVLFKTQRAAIAAAEKFAKR